MATFPYPLFPRPQVGYQLNTDPNVIETEMESGIYRRRKRYIGETYVVPLAWRLTNVQIELFRSWVKHHLNDGVNSFTIDLDLGGGFQPYTAHFNDAPVYEDQGTFWTANGVVRLESDPYIPDEETLNAYILANGDVEGFKAASTALDDLVEITIPAATDNLN